MKPPGRNNAHIPLLVVMIVGLVTLIAVVGAIWLIVLERPMESVLIVSGIAVTGTTSLTAMLAKTDRTHDGDKATPVTVENLPGNPVPVEESHP